jgi:hypothetical protein
METLFSMLGLYQLSALVLPGAVSVTGAYYAVVGRPHDPSTAGVLGLLVLFYVAGNVIQGAAVFWEERYWKRSGGWPSARRMTRADTKAYEPPLQELIGRKLDAVAGSDTSALSVEDKFALARAELRRQNQDVRSESFNSIYGLSRGLVSAGALVVGVALVCVIAGHASHRNWIVALIVGVCALPVFRRFVRFSFYFADQVWHDFAALPEPSSAGRDLSS